MSEVNVKKRPVESKPLYLRRLAKAGSSRYLSLGTIVPKDWLNVKVYVEQISDKCCVLRIEPVR